MKIKATPEMFGFLRPLANSNSFPHECSSNAGSVITFCFPRLRGCDPEGEAVGAYTYFSNQERLLTPSEIANWYAVQTMSRHERVVAHQLKSQGITTFLPAFTELHYWSDRRKKIEAPLFPGYLFIHTSISPDVRRSVSFARGVAGFITMGGAPVPIPNEQIENVHKLLANDIPCTHHPFLKVRERVRVRGGSLDGLQGILVACDGQKGLVVSVEGIQRSLAVHIEGYDIETL